MRKIFILFNLIVLILLISSCEDILNPNNETHRTKIKYHAVLKDQEHSVIMPLKVGNEWEYKFTRTGSSEVEYYKTIVRRDTLIDGKKWFIVSDALHLMSGNIFTNTDNGLFVFSTCNCTCLGLRAEYPANFKTYYFMKFKYSPLFVNYYTDNGEFIKSDEITAELDSWIDVEKIKGFPTIFGKKDCYKYHMHFDPITIKNAKASYYLSYDEYYVPDLGLVRQEYFTTNDKGLVNLIATYELIKTNVKI
ncbi:MAG: hypothetical protein WCR42_04970 [bacterium]